MHISATILGGGEWTTVHMRLKATFTIELEARDFIEAAELQRALEGKLLTLRETFPHSQLRIVNGRQRRPTGTAPRPVNPNITGRLHAYTD